MWHTRLITILGIFTLTTESLFPQACQSLIGMWTDDYNASWNLQQTGTSISGNVVTLGCDGDGRFSVTGSINSSGTFTITATSTATTDCPASTFTYTGSNSSPGCNSGTGTWNNDIGQSSPD